MNHFGGSLGGPIIHNKLFFFFDSEWVRIALPIVTATTVPTAAFQQYVFSNFRWVARTRSLARSIPPRRNWCRSIKRCSRSTEIPAERRSPYWDARSTSAERRRIANDGNGCANRQSVSHSSDDHEQVQTARIDYNINAKKHDLVPLSGRYRPASRLHRPDQFAVRFRFSPASLFFRCGIYARLFPKSGQLFQSGIFLV